MADERPKPNCGDIFLAVHEGASRSDMKNALNEYFGVTLSLTMRVTQVGMDRVGDQALAVKLARKLGFNRRCEQLRAFGHQNWGILQDANTYLQQMEADVPDSVVYGFCEAAQYMGMDAPHFVGPEHFYAFAQTGQNDVGLLASLRFEECRRLQAIASYS